MHLMSAWLVAHNGALVVLVLSVALCAKSTVYSTVLAPPG